MQFLKESEEIDLPFIPGTQFSGEILEVNDIHLDIFKPGDQVMVISGITNITSKILVIIIPNYNNYYRCYKYRWRPITTMFSS